MCSFINSFIVSWLNASKRDFKAFISSLSLPIKPLIKVLEASMAPNGLLLKRTTNFVGLERKRRPRISVALYAAY
jgi:hypothetical protein